MNSYLPLYYYTKIIITLINMVHLFSHESLFYVAFHSAPQKRKLHRRAFGIVIVSILPIWLFHLCNLIPRRTVNIDVETYGPARTDIHLTAGLGFDMKLSDYFDSTYLSPMRNSGSTNVSFVLTSDSIASSIFNYKKVQNQFNQIRTFFPDDSDVDSLNSFVNIRYEIERSNKLNIISLLLGHRYTGEKVQKDESKRFITSNIRTNTSNKIDSEYGLAYKDTIQGMGYAQGTTETKKHSILYNNALWSLSDISQAYIGVHLSGRQYAPDWKEWGYEGFDMSANPISLTIDFGAPISVSEMTPSPDRIDMTRITFSDPDKIRRIIYNGLIFHVKFLHHENLQSVKLFCLTTIIAGLFTWLMSTLWKWYQITKNKYRKIKNRRNSNA